MIDLIFYLGAYWSAGLSLKIGDDLLDESGRPDLAWYPLAATGFLFGILMSISEWDFILLGSIVLGVILSGKVNRREFIIGFVLIGIGLLFFGMPPITDTLERLALFFMLFMAAVLDEKGTSWTDREISHKAYYFFEYRFTLKVAALLLSIPWNGFFPTALGLWTFDIGYEIAGFIMKRVG